MQFIPHCLLADDIAGQLFNENGVLTDPYLLSQQGVQVNPRFIRELCGGKIEAWHSRGCSCHQSTTVFKVIEGRTENPRNSETVTIPPSLTLSFPPVCLLSMDLAVVVDDYAKKHYYKTYRMEKERKKAAMLYTALVTAWPLWSMCIQPAFRELGLACKAWRNLWMDERMNGDCVWTEK